MKKAIVFLLFLFLLAPLSHAEAEYNYVYFNLNEPKPIAIYFVYNASVVPFVYFTTIKESTIVGFVPYNRVILLVSNYSFEVNGKVAGFNQYFNGYVYEFEVKHDMTLNINFLSYPIDTTAIVWIDFPPPNTTITYSVSPIIVTSTTITTTRQDIISILEQNIVFVLFFSLITVGLVGVLIERGKKGDDFSPLPRDKRLGVWRYIQAGYRRVSEDSRDTLGNVGENGTS